MNTYGIYRITYLTYLCSEQSKKVFEFRPWLCRSSGHLWLCAYDCCIHTMPCPQTHPEVLMSSRLICWFNFVLIRDPLSKRSEKLFWPVKWAWEMAAASFLMPWVSCFAFFFVSVLQRYLQKFGYLDHDTGGGGLAAQVHRDDFITAVRTFQGFSGLQVTGTSGLCNLWSLLLPLSIEWGRERRSNWKSHKSSPPPAFKFSPPPFFMPLSKCARARKKNPTNTRRLSTTLLNRTTPSQCTLFAERESERDRESGSCISSRRGEKSTLDRVEKSSGGICCRGLLLIALHSWHPIACVARGPDLLQGQDWPMTWTCPCLGLSIFAVSPLHWLV